MKPFEITNFFPSKGDSNFLGFAGVKFYKLTGKGLKPKFTKVRIFRNSHNGHVFFSYHAEKYLDKEGKDKYNDLIRHVDKQDAEIDQEDFAIAWNEYMANSQPKLPEQQQEETTYYPHGLCQKTQPIQNTQQQEELPF